MMLERRRLIIKKHRIEIIGDAVLYLGDCMEIVPADRGGVSDG